MGIVVALLLKTRFPPRVVFAVCIFAGAAASAAAALFVGRNACWALICMAWSILPQVGAFSIPFSLLAVVNHRAKQEDKQVSTALQMSLLNCCVTIGQQVSTVTLSAMEANMSMHQALLIIWAMAAIVQTVGGVGALCLDDMIHEGDKSGEPGDVESCREISL